MFASTRHADGGLGARVRRSGANASGLVFLDRGCQSQGLGVQSGPREFGGGTRLDDRIRDLGAPRWVLRPFGICLSGNKKSSGF